MRTIISFSLVVFLTGIPCGFSDEISDRFYGADSSPLSPVVSEKKAATSRVPELDKTKTASAQTSENFLMGGGLSAPPTQGPLFSQLKETTLEKAQNLGLSFEEKQRVVLALQKIEGLLLVQKEESFGVGNKDYSLNDFIAPPLGDLGTIVGDSVADDLLDSQKTPPDRGLEKQSGKIQDFWQAFFNAVAKYKSDVEQYRARVSVLDESSGMLGSDVMSQSRTILTRVKSKQSSEIKKQEALKLLGTPTNEMNETLLGAILEHSKWESDLERTQNLALMNAVIHPSRQMHPFTRFLIKQRFVDEEMVRAYTRELERMRTEQKLDNPQELPAKFRKLIREQSLVKLLAKDGIGAVLAAMQKS